MPQEFIVVRCYDCETFQSQQVKKIPKWVCKMCGQKQSLKKVYGKGTGAECRKLVQSLNLTAGELEETQTQESEQVMNPRQAIQSAEIAEHSQATDIPSKWADFIEEPAAIRTEQDYPGDGVAMTTERPPPSRRGGQKGHSRMSGRGRMMKRKGSNNQCNDSAERHPPASNSYKENQVPTGDNYPSGVSSMSSSFELASRLKEESHSPQKMVKRSGSVDTNVNVVSNKQANPINQKLCKVSGQPTKQVGGALTSTRQAQPCSKSLKIVRTGQKVSETAANSKWGAFLDEEKRENDVPEEEYDDSYFDATVNDDLVTTDRAQALFSLGNVAELDLSWED